MTLTDISRTKRGHLALYFDGAFAFSLSPEAYAASGLQVGSQLDEDEVNALRRRSEVEKAKNKALTLLSYKDYTEAELQKRLRETVSPEAAAEAAARMVSLGLVNDGDYAERFARALSQRKGFGPARVRMELRSKGLDAQDVEQALEQLETDPVEQARALLEKKYPLWRDDERVKRRAYGALARRGFGSEDIRRAMADADYD